MLLGRSSSRAIADAAWPSPSWSGRAGSCSPVTAVARRRSRLGAAGIAPLPHRPPPAAPPTPPRPDLVWAHARRRFDALRSEYAAYECDPMAVLRLPALADVIGAEHRPLRRRVRRGAGPRHRRVPAEAPTPRRSSSRSTAPSGPGARPARPPSGSACPHLTPAERATVERVIKLLTTARDSDNDAERLAAYARARSELATPGPGRSDPHAAARRTAALDVAGRGPAPGLTARIPAAAPAARPCTIGNAAAHEAAARLCTRAAGGVHGGRCEHLVEEAARSSSPTVSATSAARPRCAAEARGRARRCPWRTPAPSR